MLPVVALIQAKKGQAKALESVLRTLVAPTRQETGCLQYDLHVDNDQAGMFVFIERWESEEFLEAHLQSAHVQEAMARKNELIESVEIRQLSPL